MKALVLGNGPSVNNHTVAEYRKFTTIGVNQISRKFDPEYVFLIDPPARFEEGLPWAQRSIRTILSAPIVFRDRLEDWCMVGRQDGNKVSRDDFIAFDIFLTDHRWDRFEKADYEALRHYWSQDDKENLKLPFGPTSTGVAVWWAIYLGATEVGVIGLDYTKGYFYNPEKLFGSRSGLQRSLDQWQGLHRTARDIFGANIWNLSPESKIDTLPFKEMCDL